MPTKEQLLQLASAFEVVGYAPHATQWTIHKALCDYRLGLAAGGIRSGKSYFIAYDQMARALQHTDEHGGLFLQWLVGKYYRDTHKEFTYMQDVLTKLNIIIPNRLSKPRMGGWAMDARLPNGGIIRVETKASDDETQLSRDAPHQIGICEAGTCSYPTYTRCIERLSEMDGRLLLSGTFEEAQYGWYEQLYEEWQDPLNLDGGISISMPSWTNTYVYPGGRYDPKIVQMETAFRLVPGLFEARVAGRPMPPKGRVFKSFQPEIHVGERLFQPRAVGGLLKPVYLAVDPAHSNPYAVAVIQLEGNRIRVVDEVYEIGSYTRQVIEECKKRDWWPNVIKNNEPLSNWDSVYYTAGAIDSAAPSDAAVWMVEGKVTLASNVVPIPAGIRRLETFLAETGSLLVDEKCVNLIAEFKDYRYRDPRSEFVARKENPIDRYNHLIKGIIYFLVMKFGFFDVEGIALEAERVVRRGAERPYARMKQAYGL